MKIYWDSSALIEALHDPDIRDRLKPSYNAPGSISGFSTLKVPVKISEP